MCVYISINSHQQFPHCKYRNIDKPGANQGMQNLNLQLQNSTTLV